VRLTVGSIAWENCDCFKIRYMLRLGSLMSLKGPCAEGLVSSLRHYWEVVEPLGGGAYWEELRSLWACPKGPRDPTSPLFHFSSHNEVNRLPLPCSSSMTYCLTTGPKETGPNDHA
jgi:hypothetical protein